MPGISRRPSLGKLIFTSYERDRGSATMPFSLTVPLTGVPPAASTVTVAFCPTAIRAISFSGTDIFAFSRPTDTSLATVVPAPTFCPFSADLLAITPENGAYRRQSASCLRAICSAARARSSAVCASTHFISGRLPLPCSSFILPYASSACSSAAFAEAWLLRICSGSSVAMSCPLLTRSPSSTSMLLTVPPTAKLSSVPFSSSIVPE